MQDVMLSGVVSSQTSSSLVVASTPGLVSVSCVAMPTVAAGKLTSLTDHNVFVNLQSTANSG